MSRAYDKKNQDKQYDFLTGGGEMGALMRSHDWEATPLGSPATWPATLKTVIRLLLTSNHPMFVWWGEALIQFYNDAYRQTMGPERHPSALGQPGKECWAEAWHIIGPEIDWVLSGKGATWHENALVPVTRHGRREDVYWTYGYSPIADEAGVQGVLVICNDVTSQFQASQTLRQSYRTLVESMDEAFSLIEILFNSQGNPADYRFLECNAAFTEQTGLTDPIGKTAKELVPDLEDRWIQMYGKVALTGEAVRFVEHAPSMGRWFDVYATRVGDAPSRKVALLFKDITAQKRNEAALLQSQREALLAAHQAEEERARMKALLEIAPVGIIYADQDGRILHSNTETQRIWGNHPMSCGIEHYHEWQGWWADASDKDGQPVQPHEWPLARALRGEEVAGDVFEIAPFPPQNEHRTVMIRAVPIRNAKGDVSGAVIAQLDISERNKHEAERQHFVSLANRSTDFIAMADLHLKPTYINAAGMEMVGLDSLDQGMATPIMEYFFPEDVPFVEQEFFPKVLKEGSAEVEIRFRHLKSDKAMWMHYHVYTLLDYKGNTTGYATVSRNITDSKLAAQALQENEAKFRTIANAMPQMIWSTLPDGYHDYYNDRWYEYTGMPRGSTDGEGWNGMFHPDDRQRAWERWHRSLTTGEVYEIEYRLRHHSGEYRWVLGRALPIRNGAGNIIRWMGTCTDIHEQKLTQHALIEADQRKDEFISVLAHELRNPLAPIRTAVDLIHMVDVRQPLLQQAIAVMDRQLSHMTSLIDDLLDVARISKGKVDLKLQPCNIAQIATNVANDYRKNIESNGVQLNTAVPDDPVWGNADPTRLSQIIGNLLHNACKFTKPGDSITISLEVEPIASQSRAVMTISDTGLGIAPELLPELFSPFSQARQDLSRSSGGLGLGLTVVRGLVELHGGTVSAHSAGIGQGATFVITLPICATPGATVEEAHAPASERRTLKILLIEDGEDLLQILSGALILQGHEVMTATTAHAGLALAQQHNPEVVISDIGLPDMDGYELARNLRLLPQIRQPVLVAMTGYGQHEAKLRAKESGFDHHLTKPVNIKTFLNLLNDFAFDKN